MTTNISIRTDKETKEKAEKLFNELGLNMSVAINMFLKQAIRENGVPFMATLNIPNSETIEAIKESERMLQDPNCVGYGSIDELRRALSL